MYNISNNDKLQKKCILEKICDNGEPTFCMFWRHNAPGAGADCEVVYDWNGSYAVSSSSDSDGFVGPYDSLDAALSDNDQLLMVTPATESIKCASLSGEAIAVMLWSETDKPLAFMINGEKWQNERGSGFRMASA
jgi:hypothetical protein